MRGNAIQETVDMGAPPFAEPAADSAPPEPQLNTSPKSVTASIKALRYELPPMATPTTSSAPRPAQAGWVHRVPLLNVDLVVQRRHVDGPSQAGM